MHTEIHSHRPFTLALFAAVLALALISCSSDSGMSDLTTMGSGTMGDGFLPSDGTVTGTIAVEATQPSGRSGASTDIDGMVLTMDDGMAEIPMDDQGNFEITDLLDGDHTLFLHHGDGTTTGIPFRMLHQRGLGMGMITIRDGYLEGHTGFDGYLFGFIDEDGDGINDLFTDADGDGISDMGTPYAGSPYFMDGGYVDADGDGINDRFQDADGDGYNDVDGMPFGHGFGFMDEDHDGYNDHFVDGNGDGINDVTGMPFSHPFGYRDENNDGMNDLFLDSDGDGVNDITNAHYTAMPGWVDLDGDGLNDFFRDADGNGMVDPGWVDLDGDGLDDFFRDLDGNGVIDMVEGNMSFAHGFGWVDSDNDGVNDHFADANGDMINDHDDGPYANMFYGHGFMQAHIDGDGNGIDDVSGLPYHHGFGWIDADSDHINDVFMDTDGDGINELTGHHYDEGYLADHDNHDGMMDDEIEWPMPDRDHGMM